MKMSVEAKDRKRRARSDRKGADAHGQDTDLLDFVMALDKMDVPEDATVFETMADVPVGTESVAPTEQETRSLRRADKRAKQTLETDADVDDFAAVLDGGDASFAGLKKRMAVISGRETEGVRRSAIKVVDAPLPASQQGQIDRSVAYERTTRDISKWAPVIQKNRDAEQLKFPLQQEAMAPPRVSSHTLVSTFSPTTELEKEISGIMARDGVTFIGTASKTATPAGTLDDLPVVHLDPEQVHRDMVRLRSSKFFADIRSRRQAKIKSKTYRKMLAKERMRAEAEAIASGNLGALGKLGMLSTTADDEDARRERRMKLEMDRARERLTLRTRKVNKWAQELLHRRHGDADGRLKIIEQLKDKERLRQEIYGARDELDELDELDEASDASDASEDEEDGDGAAGTDADADADAGNALEHAPVDDYEVQEIFDRVAKERTAVTGRHKFGPTDASPVHESDEDQDDLDAEMDKSIVRVTEKKPLATTVHDDCDSDGEARWQMQRGLIREAFADDNVFAEFAAEKEAAMRADAPKTEDVTLPGWGMWAGAGISVEDSRPRKRFVLHKDGLDPRARLDKNLKHVIINERRIKAAARAFTVPTVPFPFTSAEMHARHIAHPIGKEWNTVISHQKRIKPRVVSKAGSIIAPIKFFKQSKQV